MKLLNTANMEMANCPEVSGADMTLMGPFHLSSSDLHHWHSHCLPHPHPGLVPVPSSEWPLEIVVGGEQD